MRVVLGGLVELLSELEETGAELVDSEADIVFLGVERRDDLAGIPAAWSRLAGRGALWLVYPRGAREVTEADVLAAGRAAGLLDVKVIRFSETHTAHRLVAPRPGR